jgi:antitoxin PrlF
LAYRWTVNRPDQQSRGRRWMPYNTVLPKCHYREQFVRLTVKGQVTIPKRVRERLGIGPGDDVEFVEDQGTIRLQKRLPASPFHKYRGYLGELAGRDPDDLVEKMRGQ